MGIAGDYESAVRKALIASNHSINPGDNVLLSIADAAKPDAMPLIESLCEQGHGDLRDFRHSRPSAGARLRRHAG